MVFSPAPLYLDPHNWNHHQQQTQIHQQSQQLNTTLTHGGGIDEGSGGADNPHHQILAVHMPPPLPSQAVGGGTSSSIRPGSMADRARQAKIPQPESGLKCPRCSSTNTKFCYFNNYSLTQPRHFCKMCRRYWTKGGALRTVPVGGGCRKNNKRSNKSGGASKAVGDHQGGIGPSHNNSTSPISSNCNNTDMNNMLDNTSLTGQSFQPRMTQFPLLASLQGLNHGQYVPPTSNNLGLNFGGMMNTSAQAELGFHIGSSANNGNSDHQWRPNHFPNNFLAAFDPSQFSNRSPSSSSSLYHFPIDHHSLDQQAPNPIPLRSSPFSTAINQHLVRPSSMSLKNSTDLKNDEAAAVKAEEAAASQGGMNSQSRSYQGLSDNNQYWIANNNSTNTTWTDLSGVNSSTTRLL